ncbi:MAG: dihydropyrimidine dehydrogenase, partial [Candidatus Omnitrophica bacterium]|nr:dihydropyrimidine dehydrogenase [Candidatus Omnitrophota bacterium]
MPAREPKRRSQNFEEVALGFGVDQAIEEANRCLSCKKPKCVDGCPVMVDIPNFIEAVRNGNLSDAAHILKEKNSLPAVCGR